MVQDLDGRTGPSLEIEVPRWKRRRTTTNGGRNNLLYNYNNVSVCPSVRRRFRVLMDAAEPARTVGFGKRDSARTVGFGKRDSKMGFGTGPDNQIRKTGFGKRVPGFGKTGGQTGQGGAGGRAGSVCPSVLQGRGQGRAGRAGAK